MRTYKFRIYPSKQQQILMEKHLQISKNIWNELLAMTKQSYTDFGYFTSIKTLENCTKKSGIYSQTARHIAQRLDFVIWQKFKLEKKGIKRGFPRFKKKMTFLHYPGTGFWIDDKLRVSPFGYIKMKKHQEIKGKVKTITLKKDTCGKWHVLIVTDYTPTTKTISQEKIGIDFNLENFATLSNGERIENPRFLKNKEDRIITLQKRLSKKKRDSKNRKKAIKRLAVEHKKVENARTDFHHKLSTQLVKRYGLLAVEDLTIEGLSRTFLAKSFHDVGISSFLLKLQYKAESAGVAVVKVNPRGTTQECSKCGNMVNKTLSQRMHDCPACGLSLSRDHNSAINILNRATVGHTGSNACGVVAGVTAMKQELSDNEDKCHEYLPL